MPQDQPKPTWGQKVFKRVNGTLTIYLVIAILFVATIGYFLMQEKTKLRTERTEAAEQAKNLEMQMAGLRAMSHLDGRVLKLEQELIALAKEKQRRGESNLDLDTPAVAFKICELAERYADDGMEPSMILGVIEVESMFDPKATSTFVKDGKSVPLARGLMQVLDSTAAPYLQRMNLERSANTLYNPLYNIEVGAAILVDEHRSWMAKGLEDTHDWHLSIDSYFWGDRWVAESLSGASSSRTTFATMSYWKKVRDAQNRWKEKGF